MDLEKTILRKVGEAIGRFKMIRHGDRVAVGVSGGKDSLTLLEALLLLQKRAPIQFSVQAFTIEQGKFLAPIHPVGEFLKARGIDWTYVQDSPSLNLLVDQPDHGCDVCSRFRRRAVYEVARGLGANVEAPNSSARFKRKFKRPFPGARSARRSIRSSPSLSPAFPAACATAASRRALRTRLWRARLTRVR